METMAADVVAVVAGAALTVAAKAVIVAVEDAVRNTTTGIRSRSGRRTSGTSNQTSTRT